MKNPTRKNFSAYLAHLATLNGVESAAQMFTVAPSVQQKLESRIQESSAFLQSIGIYPVDEMQGQKIGIGTDGPVASRTDTTGADRGTRDAASLGGQGYQCVQTNYDTHVRYATLDMWAKFPDFQLRLSRAIQQQCALDRPDRGATDIAVLILEGFGVIADVLGNSSQVFEIEQQQALVISNAEDNIQHAGLHVVEVQQTGQQQRAEVRYRGPHGVTFFAEDIPHRDRITMRLPVGNADVFQAGEQLFRGLSFFGHAG